jgi:hypothetical protein
MLLSEAFRMSRTSPATMKPALAALDTSRFAATAFRGLDTSRFAATAFRGLDASEVMKSVLTLLNTSGVMKAALAGPHTSGLMKPALAGLDTSRFAATAFRGLDTTWFAATAFRGLDTSEVMKSVLAGMDRSRWLTELDVLVQQGSSTLGDANLTHEGLEADELVQVVSEISTRIEQAISRLRQIASWTRNHNQAIAIWLGVLGTWLAVLLALLALHSNSPSISVQINPQLPNSKPGPGTPNQHVQMGRCAN